MRCLWLVALSALTIGVLNFMVLIMQEEAVSDLGRSNEALRAEVLELRDENGRLERELMQSMSIFVNGGFDTE
ncbi:hypothetical protein [uncultured Treponema sp.]|jgi:hypothetical protein|uniref:hypothetical protein n=1 Tax=uncultured Treponema sp. TaxID=162155 RepID=UPI00280A85DA|nr:hypothetical protein [uncultured Treponema sp.]